MRKTFRISICQNKVTDNKQKNIDKAIKLLEESKSGGADMAILPEMFNCPYENSRFGEFSEEVGSGETLKAISDAAKSNSIYVIAGSIPERLDGRLYNSSFVFDRNGIIIGNHKKMHLFDIDVEGKIRFMESDTLTPGSKITVVDTEFCKVGLAICYDIRFPELHRLMALQGAKLIVIPGAFNMVTGPAHWEILMRARALDNQVYFAAASPARDEAANYIAYGNSMVVEPWGDVISRAGTDEEVIFADIDLTRVDKVRDELPLLKHRRTDIYNLSGKKG